MVSSLSDGYHIASLFTSKYHICFVNMCTYHTVDNLQAPDEGIALLEDLGDPEEDLALSNDRELYENVKDDEEEELDDEQLDEDLDTENRQLRRRGGCRRGEVRRRGRCTSRSSSRSRRRRRSSKSRSRRRRGCRRGKVNLLSHKLMFSLFFSILNVMPMCLPFTTTGSASRPLCE